MQTLNWIRLIAVRKVQPNDIEFLSFFVILLKFFMIWFDRIEQTTYPNKPVYSMDFKEKNFKIRNLFPHFGFDSVHFDLIRFKF